MGMLLPTVREAAFAPLVRQLDRLGHIQPQSLLLEGGTEEQRMDMARYWACRCNCPAALDGDADSPCLACPTCAQIVAGEHLDVLAYDGRIANKDDRENPGIVRALNMENMRALKARLRDHIHGEGRRVVLLMGMNGRDEAANALLKALEEPSPSTSFVLLAAQREQLLPTLVSRSFCLTLPWPDISGRTPGLEGWDDALATFLREGRDFLEKASAKGALTPELAGLLVLECQKSLARVMAGRGQGLLDDALGRLGPLGLAQCSTLLGDAQEMLVHSVAPARVVEGLATRLFTLLRSAQARQGSLSAQASQSRTPE